MSAICAAQTRSPTDHLETLTSDLKPFFLSKLEALHEHPMEDTTSVLC